jgi:hypothetical protein
MPKIHLSGQVLVFVSRLVPPRNLVVSKMEIERWKAFVEKEPFLVEGYEAFV